MRERDVDVRELEVVLQDHRRELSRLRAAIIHARMALGRAEGAWMVIYASIH
jgi:hypothetical protein